MIRFQSNYIFYLYITPLFLAVDKQNFDIFKLLLTNGSLDVNGLSIYFYVIYVI